MSNGWKEGKDEEVNGMSFDKFKGTDADEVRVSLDAMPERNDAIRGKGNFEAAVRALECYYWSTSGEYLTEHLPRMSTTSFTEAIKD